MEFSAEFQTASNSEIKCQGTDILIDGSIQKGIVTHMEYQVTIETEMFSVEGSEIRAMSSSELLACNPRGPSMGCVGAIENRIIYREEFNESLGMNFVQSLST